MSDARADKSEKQKHLVNFLVDSLKETFFLESIDASHMSHDVTTLVGFTREQSKGIREDNAMHVVTSNRASYKAMEGI